MTSIAALGGPLGSIEETLTALEKSRDYKNTINEKYLDTDNVDLPTKHPINIGYTFNIYFLTFYILNGKIFIKILNFYC